MTLLFYCNFCTINIVHCVCWSTNRPRCHSGIMQHKHTSIFTRIISVHLLLQCIRQNRTNKDGIGCCRNFLPQLVKLFDELNGILTGCKADVTTDFSARQIRERFLRRVKTARFVAYVVPIRIFSQQMSQHEFSC